MPARPSRSTQRRRRRPVRRLEHRLDARLLGAGAHHVGRRAPAAQQRHRLDEQRLAGAGLAGEHVEPRAELDLHVVEQREVGDAQVRQHVFLSRRRLAAKVACLLFAPVHFLAQHVEVALPASRNRRSGRRAAEISTRSPSASPRAPLPVDGELHVLGRPRRGAPSTPRRRRHDHRPVGQRVRADRRDHHRAHARASRSARRRPACTPSTRSAWRR